MLEDSERLYVRTWNNGKIWLDPVDFEKVSIETVATQLSLINRWAGSNGEPYSVAQHSILVADIAARDEASPALQMRALAHDAHEILVQDVLSPVLRWYRRYDNRGHDYLAGQFDLVAAPLFGLDPHPSELEHTRIKRYDFIAAQIERRDLFGDDVLIPQWAATLSARPQRPSYARGSFLYRFTCLTLSL